MGWSIVRLICVRELRDQLRDRRTIFMIAVLPMLLYPVLGLAIVQFAVGTSENTSTVGFVGQEYLPQLTPQSLGFQPGSVASWFNLSPCQPGLCGVLNAEAMVQVWCSQSDPPPLLIGKTIPGRYFDRSQDRSLLRVEFLPANDLHALADKQVDLVVVVDPHFAQELTVGGRPSLRIMERSGDKASQAAGRRIYGVLALEAAGARNAARPPGRYQCGHRSFRRRRPGTQSHQR